MKKQSKNVLTADDEPELSPLCITRTLHLTLTFLCLTPNWVQMRTMVSGRKFLWATSRCPGAEIAPVCWAMLRPVWGLLGSLLNSTAAAPLLHTHSPTHRDRAFPGSARFLTHGRGYRCPQIARWKAIGAPAMITRMLQPPSPSRDLFPEFLKAEPSRQSRHGTKSAFFFQRQNKKNRHAVKISCWLPRLTPDSHLLSDGAPVLKWLFFLISIVYIRTQAHALYI